MGESNAIGYQIKGNTMRHTRVYPVKLLDKEEINPNTQNCTIVLI